jgi:hypothetical protein
VKNSPAASAIRHARWRVKPESKHKIKAIRARFLERNPDYRFYESIKSNYGLTRAQYDSLLILQNGVCAICRRGPEGSGKKRLTVDHDHRTGEVRGLLCNHCNVALGNLRDDPLVTRAAAAYLESSHDHVELVKKLV